MAENEDGSSLAEQQVLVILEKNKDEMLVGYQCYLGVKQHRNECSVLSFRQFLFATAIVRLLRQEMKDQTQTAPSSVPAFVQVCLQH